MASICLSRPGWTPALICLPLISSAASPPATAFVTHGSIRPVVHTGPAATRFLGQRPANTATGTTGDDRFSFALSVFLFRSGQMHSTGDPPRPRGRARPQPRQRPAQPPTAGPSGRSIGPLVKGHDTGAAKAEVVLQGQSGIGYLTLAGFSPKLLDQLRTLGVAPSGCPLHSRPPEGLTTRRPPYVLSPSATNFSAPTSGHRRSAS